MTALMQVCLCIGESIIAAWLVARSRAPSFESVNQQRKQKTTKKYENKIKLNLTLNKTLTASRLHRAEDTCFTYL